MDVLRIIYGIAFLFILVIGAKRNNLITLVIGAIGIALLILATLLPDWKVDPIVFVIPIYITSITSVIVYWPKLLKN